MFINMAGDQMNGVLLNIYFISLKVNTSWNQRLNKKHSIASVSASVFKCINNLKGHSKLCSNIPNFILPIYTVSEALNDL